MAQTFEVFNQDNGPDGVSSYSINCSTSGTDRIVVLFIHTDAATRRSVTGVSGASLTWAKYSHYDFDSSDPTNHKQRLEVWWAHAPTQLTSQSITATLDGNSNGPILAIGAIAGCPAARLSNPWDADPSLPFNASNPSGTPADAEVTFSTHDSHNANLFVFCCNINNVPPSTPAGWTVLHNLSYGGSVRMILFTFGKITSAQQSGTTASGGSCVQYGIQAMSLGGDPIHPHSQASCVGF